MPTNIQKLYASIKFKKDRNSTYYIVRNDFESSVSNIKIYNGAMLLVSGVTTSDDSLLVSVMYKIKPKNITSVDEGLVKITYDELISLLIAGRIVAYYTDIDKPDEEINKLIKIYQK